MRLAAIDIGSNAARMLIVDVRNTLKKPIFNKLNLIRIPLRLGFDVFVNGKIGTQKRKMLLHMMKAFKELMKLYNVDEVKAIATSAMRNAKNSDDIIKEIKKETGIKIKVISGVKEADLLFQIHAAEKINRNKTYLYVNVGGGSTELSIYEEGSGQANCSVEIGTVRLLKNKVKSSQWKELQTKVIEYKKKYDIHALIGTGGNINKVLSLSGNSPEQPLYYNELIKLHKKLSKLTTAQRMEQYRLKGDRADVIVPALEIYTSVMKWSKSKIIYVPKMGLVDGIIYSLFTQMKRGD